MDGAGALTAQPDTRLTTLERGLQEATARIRDVMLVVNCAADQLAGPVNEKAGAEVGEAPMPGPGAGAVNKLEHQMNALARAITDLGNEAQRLSSANIVA